MFLWKNYVQLLCCYEIAMHELMFLCIFSLELNYY